MHSPEAEMLDLGYFCHGAEYVRVPTLGSLFDDFPATKTVKIGRNQKLEAKVSYWPCDKAYVLDTEALTMLPTIRVGGFTIEEIKRKTDVCSHTV